jgi:RsiW-degrading membrane proteinase PrsW (M82 family)
LGVYLSKVYDEHIDGIIYGITAGLGLAALENFVSVTIFGGQAILFRFATSTLMHALVGGIMGYFMAMAKFTRYKKTFMSLGLVIAIVLHGSYNLIAQIRDNRGLLFMCLSLVIMFVVLLVLIKKAKSLDPVKFRQKLN